MYLLQINEGGGNENENTFIDISGKPFIFVDSIIQFKDDIEGGRE